MTQRVFDIENEKDMQDLWDILQDHIIKMVKPFTSGYLYPKYVLARSEEGEYELPININWHDKTEITRPIQEATEADVDKLCVFWNDDDKESDFGILAEINGIERPYRLDNKLADGVDGTELWYDHCRRLTKQEIEELI